jgi:hypothetical protein
MGNGEWGECIVDVFVIVNTVSGSAASITFSSELSWKAFGGNICVWELLYELPVFNSEVILSSER